MNNNDKMKSYIRKHTLRSTLGASGDAIARAGEIQLKAWVIALGGDPDDVIATASNDWVEDSVPVAPSKSLSPAEAKLKAMQELLGGGGLNEENVKQIVSDTISADVLPTIDSIRSKVDALDAVSETLEKIAEAMKSTTSTRLPLATAVASGGNPILELVAPFYKAGSKNPTKVCVSAPPSYGKSYSIGLLGESYDEFITHGCSGDMDEWSMLLGSCTPKKEGGFITTDGLLAQAVRSASEGNNTLLFLDEVFRMSETTMESMLAFLAPQPDASGELVYKLTTKQNDGGVLETLTCSAEKLHIVCATNLSHIEPPEAFMDRFLFKHVRYSADIIKRIASSLSDRYDISGGDDLAEIYAEAMGESRGMFSTGQIKKPLSIRDLERGMQHAKDSTKESVVDWISGNGLDALLMWNSDTGDIIKDSEDGVKKITDLLNK